MLGEWGAREVWSLYPPRRTGWGLSSLWVLLPHCSLGIVGSPRPQALSLPSLQYLRRTRGSEVEGGASNLTPAHSPGVTPMEGTAPPIRGLWARGCGVSRDGLSWFWRGRGGLWLEACILLTRRVDVILYSWCPVSSADLAQGEAAWGLWSVWDSAPKPGWPPLC